MAAAQPSTDTRSCVCEWSRQVPAWLIDVARLLELTLLSHAPSMCTSIRERLSMGILPHHGASTIVKADTLHSVYSLNPVLMQLPSSHGTKPE